MKLLLRGQLYSQISRLNRVEFLPGMAGPRGKRTFYRARGIVVISRDELPQLAEWSIECRDATYPLELALAPYKSELGVITTFAKLNEARK